MKRKVTAKVDLVLKGFGLKKELSAGQSLVLNDDDWDTYGSDAKRFIGSGSLFFEEVDDSTPDGDAPSTADLKTKHNELVKDLDTDKGVSDKDHETKHKI